MKIEKLTDNKIRIIINIDELSKKNIDLHTLTQNSDKTHSLFKNILDEAEKQVGFKVKNCKLLIEAFSTSEGYVIFTLTKYKNDITTEKNSRKLIYRRKSLGNSYKNAVYKFSNFEEFCNFCTYCKNTSLSNLKDLAKNIALYEYNNSYYLVLSNINTQSYNSNLFFIAISEFSNLVSSSIIFKSKLDEHGKIIFKTNAINKCIKYFVPI